MPQFKPGDRVKCVDQGGAMSYLFLNKVYTIHKVDQNTDRVYLKDDGKIKQTMDWYSTRFVLINKKNTPKELT